MSVCNAVCRHACKVHATKCCEHKNVENLNIKYGFLIAINVGLARRVCRVLRQRRYVHTLVNICWWLWKERNRLAHIICQR